MNDATIGRNYAEALLSLAKKANDLPGWGAMIGDVAEAMQRDRKLHVFLESPRVSASQKNAVLAKAFQDRMPRLFVRFLQSVVNHRRQMLIPAIAAEYQLLLDDVMGRLHARVTVARETSAEEVAVIAKQLTRAYGKQVVPHVTVNPAIRGGVIVRVGDTVMDGSVRKRLATLRQRMMVGSR